MIELCREYLSVRCIWLYDLIMSRTLFGVNPHSIVAWMSRNSLLEAGAKSEVYLSDCHWTRTRRHHLVHKRTLKHFSQTDHEFWWFVLSHALENCLKQKIVETYYIKTSTFIKYSSKLWHWICSIEMVWHRSLSYLF